MAARPSSRMADDEPETIREWRQLLAYHEAEAGKLRAALAEYDRVAEPRPPIVSNEKLIERSWLGP